MLKKERDLEREISAHLDLEAEESGDYGARRALASSSRERGCSRSMGLDSARAIRPRYSLWAETIRRNPGFSFIAILTLAFGIGVNTAMFSAVDAVLIRPLPYADADRLVMIWDDLSRSGDASKQFSTPFEWYEWRGHNTVFSDIVSSPMAVRKARFARA